MTSKEQVVLNRIESKMDEILEMLLDPDGGVYARVNENTRWRKVGQWFTAITTTTILGGIIKIIFFGPVG